MASVSGSTLNFSSFVIFTIRIWSSPFIRCSSYTFSFDAYLAEQERNAGRESYRLFQPIKTV